MDMRGRVWDSVLEVRHKGSTLFEHVDNCVSLESDQVMSAKVRVFLRSCSFLWMCDGTCAVIFGQC